MCMFFVLRGFDLQTWGVWICVSPGWETLPATPPGAGSAPCPAPKAQPRAFLLVMPSCSAAPRFGGRRICSGEELAAGNTLCSLGWHLGSHRGKTF